MHFLEINFLRCINAVGCVKKRHTPRCIHKMQAILSVYMGASRNISYSSTDHLYKNIIFGLVFSIRQMIFLMLLCFNTLSVFILFQNEYSLCFCIYFVWLSPLYLVRSSFGAVNLILVLYVFLWTVTWCFVYLHLILCWYHTQPTYCSHWFRP